jgi:DNA-binding MarR family transcriptional regulator
LLLQLACLIILGMASRESDLVRGAWPVFLRSCLILMERLDRQLQASVGLQLSWFEVLSQLSTKPQGMMPMKQLAESVCLTKSGASRLVDRMAHARLVTRNACQTDGRVVYACLTPEGRSAYEQALPVAHRGVEEHFARHLTPTEAEVMAGALTRVLTAAGCAGRWS